MSGTPSSPAVLVISMGVSGCGKSTLAKQLAKQFGFMFLEADDFHSAENKAHMASGQPLTDDMREPWIKSLCDRLMELRGENKSCVLAYSGLRRAHRQRFRELGYPTLFLHLTGPRELIRRRMESRVNHFAPAGLLDSQFDALEAAQDEADIIAIKINQSIRNIQQQASSLVEDFVKEHAE